MPRQILAICLLLASLAGGLMAAGDYTYPILSNEVRSTTPAFNSTLRLELVPVCESEDIVVQVLDGHHRPLAEADVELYNYTHGRQLDAETATTWNGWAYFRGRPAGRYDLIARQSNLTMGQIYFKIPPCLSPPSGADFGPADYAPAKARPQIVHRYAGGRTREFYAITLPDGRAATRVAVRATLAADGKAWNMTERIPRAVASRPEAVGFEQNYPNDIRMKDGVLELEWDVNGYGQALEREYMIYRPLNQEMAGLFGSPEMGRMAETAGGNQSAPTAMAAPVTPPPASAAGGPLEAQMNPWMVAGVLLPVLVLGAAVALRRKPAPKEADEEAAKEE